MKSFFAISLICLFLWLESVANVEAQAIGGGSTALSGIQARGKETWQWWSYDEVSERAEVASFGRRGDVPLMARWFPSDLSDASPQLGAASPGIAVFEKDREEISWRVLTPEGRLELVSFGGEGDLVVAGADFDGSGVDDLAVVKLVNGSARWRMQMNSFGGDAEAISERSLVFGANGDRVFFAAPDGQADWIGIVRRSASGRTIVRMRDVFTNQRVTQRRFPRSLSGGSRPRPVPLKGPAGEGADRLVFPIKAGTATQIIVTTLDGRRVRRLVVKDLESFAVGEFDSIPGEDLAFLKRGRVRVVNVDTRTVSKFSVGASSELVDEYQISGFQASTNDGSAVTSCENASPFDGSEGFVWKPNSDTQFFAVVVLAPRYTGVATRVTVKRLNGEEIKELRYKGVGNGGRTAWQDYQLTGAAYRSTYGSIQLEVQLRGGSCLSYVIRDPSVRVD